MFKSSSKSGRRTEDSYIEDLLTRLRGLQPLEDEPEFFYDQATLLRFLKARSWDVAAAEKQLRATVEWRRKHKPLHAPCTWCDTLPGRHCMRQIGFDREGRPVVYSCFWQASVQKLSVQEAVDHCVYVLENAVRTMPKELANWCFIVDCTGMNAACCNPRMGFECCDIFGRYYPERMFKTFCVNHNPLFQWMWNAIKVLLPVETSSKVNLISKKKIPDVFREHFPDDVAEWLLKEIELNKRNFASQKAFWLGPGEALTNGASSSSKADMEHDPRGAASYVNKYVLPLDDGSGEKNFVNGHRPHPNIVLHSKPVARTSIGGPDKEDSPRSSTADYDGPEFPEIPPELLQSTDKPSKSKH